MDTTQQTELIPADVSVEALADLLGLAPRTVAGYSARGELPAAIDGMMPLRASVRQHVARLRANQARGVRPDIVGRADAETRFEIIAAAIERLAVDVDRGAAAHRLGRLLLEAILARIDRLIAYSVDSQRTKLLRLASDVRADAASLLTEIGGDADVR